MAVEGSVPSSERARLKVLASKRGRTQQQKKGLGKVLTSSSRTTLQVLPLCIPISTAENTSQCRGPCWGAETSLGQEQGWGLQLDTYHGSSYHQLFSNSAKQDS